MVVKKGTEGLFWSIDARKKRCFFLGADFDVTSAKETFAVGFRAAIDIVSSRYNNIRVEGSAGIGCCL